MSSILEHISEFRVCCTHNDQHIQYICMSDQCYGEGRLLCQSCRQKHAIDMSSHHIRKIKQNKVLTFEELSCNSNLNDKDRFTKFFQTNNSKMKNNMMHLDKIVGKFYEKIERHLFPDHNIIHSAILQSFKPQTAINAIQLVTRPNQIKTIKIEHSKKEIQVGLQYYIQLARIHQRKPLTNPCSLQQIMRYMEAKTTQLFNKAYEQIDLILKQTAQQVTKIDFYSSQIDNEAKRQFQKNIRLERQILLNSQNQTRVLQELKKELLQYKKIKTLTIENLAKSKAITSEKLLSLMCRFESIQEINVRWSTNVQQRQIKDLLRSHQDLKILNLQNSRNINPQILQNYFKKNQCLKELNYGTNFAVNFPAYLESSWFLQGTFRRLKPFSYKQNRIFAGLKRLKNLWIGHQSEDNLQILKQLPQMQDLVIGDYIQKTNLHLPLLTHLQELGKLRSLALLQVSCQGMQSVLLKNRGLQVIFLKSCQNFSDMAILHIKSLKLLRCFSIYEHSEQIFTPLIWNAPTLQHIQLFNCKLNKDYVETTSNNLQYLKNLKSLDLSLNQWVDDFSMSKIGKLQQLKLIAIYATKVSDQGLKMIYKIQGLSVFIGGKSQITKDGMLKSLSFLSQLRKIYLGELKQADVFSQHDLMTLSNLLANLSHITIKNCVLQVKKDVLDKLSQVKFLDIEALKDEEFRKTAKDLGISFPACYQ